MGILRSAKGIQRRAASGHVPSRFAQLDRYGNRWIPDPGDVRPEPTIGPIDMSQSWLGDQM